MPRVVAFLLLTCCGCLPALAVLHPAKIFSDHMVLQRDAAVPIWGKADAGTAVTVAFAGQSAKAKADKEMFPKTLMNILIQCQEMLNKPAA